MESTITATHNSDLVALSVAIAIFGSYIAIDLVQQLIKTKAEGWVRPFLLIASALILGISVWAMHFIAMLAYQLSIPFTYDFTIIYLSMTASIIGAGAGLFVVSRRQPLQRLSLWAGALLIGLGIVGLHFMAMSSLQIAAVWFYEPKGIVLSVATAIAGSGGALWLTFRHHPETWSAKVVDQIGATVLLSTAIVGMHYLAMAALNFRQHRVSVEISSTVNHSRLGGMIAVFVLLILILTLLVYFLVVRWQSDQETAQAQQQSEARFQVLIQNASDIITIVATDGTVKYLSPSIKKVLGYSPENFLGQKAQELVHPEDRNRAEKFLKSGDRSSNNHTDEFRLRATDGTWRDFEVTLDELLNNPDIEGMVVTCRDITERKQAEVELKESQKRYQILYENAPDAYISVAVDGKIESVNQKTVDYLGYSQAELIGKAVETIIYEADRAYFRQWFRQSLQAQPVEKEDKVRKVRKDGSYFWTQGRSQLLLDRQGNPLELLMICRDITECKQTQEALEKSEAKFRSLIQNSSDLILLLDPNGIVQYASPSHQRILGYDSSWLLNQNIFDLVHPEDRENALDTFNELIAIKSNRLGTELRFQARDGSWRCLESVGNNLLDDPAVEAIVINSRDISDRKQAELQLR